MESQLGVLEAGIAFPHFTCHKSVSILRHKVPSGEPGAACVKKMRVHESQSLSHDNRSAVRRIDTAHEPF